MRKTWFLCIGALLMMAACGSKEEQRTAQIDGITFDSIVIDSTATLSSEANAPRCHIRLSLQYAKGENAGKLNNALARAEILTPDYFSIGTEKLSIHEMADSFVRRYMAEYIEDYGQLYRQDRKHASSYNNDYVVSTRTREGADGILNYIADINFFGGGEHPIRQTLVKNFRIKDGKELRLTDLFVPGYEKRLTDLIVEELCDQRDADDMQELQQQGIFIDGRTYVPDNFIINNGDITFIYCEDEIARHDIGEIRVRIKNSKLKDIMQPWN